MEKFVLFCQVESKIKGIRETRCSFVGRFLRFILACCFYAQFELNATK